MNKIAFFSGIPCLKVGLNLQNLTMSMDLSEYHFWYVLEIPESPSILKTIKTLFLDRVSEKELAVERIPATTKGSPD